MNVLFTLILGPSPFDGAISIINAATVRVRTSTARLHVGGWRSLSRLRSFRPLVKVAADGQTADGGCRKRRMDGCGSAVIAASLPLGTVQAKIGITHTTDVKQEILLREDF